MSNIRSIKTTIKEIADYWFSRVDESELSVDAAEAEDHCWRCGCERNLQRCHIIPDSRGGKDEPSNLVLLCRRCHADGPNVTDPEIMWDWIRSYSVPLYETFWSILGAKEYKFIYGRSLYEEFKSLNAADDEELLNDFRECADGVMKKASIHFGQPYFNSATMAGMYRMALKEIAAQRGLGFPIPQERFSERKPWWIRTQEITK